MRRGPAAVVAFVLALTACGDPAQPTSGTGADGGSLGAGVEVVTSVFALGALARTIAPAADVELVGAGGQGPHALELSPADRRRIEDADVVLYLGELGFQPQVEQAVPDATGEVVAAAEAVGEARLLESGSGDGGSPDPHVWLAPRLASDVGLAAGAAFARADPGHAGAYEAAAARAADELEAAGAEIDARLSGCAHDRAVLSHEAWGYLLAPRGIEQVGVSGSGGHGQASPQRLAELADLIEREGLPGVFAEPGEGRAQAEALAREAGVELFEVNPLETPPDGGEGRGYLDLLMEQVDTFATGLRCDRTG